MELMKAHGFNAIRTAHNPPSSSFLDACDRLGMLVMDEAFDQWERQKNAQDYHLYFADWWQRDVSAMVLRDRNHPSVILWSIGNEIPERAEPRGVEIAEAARSSQIKTLDATRPMTAAINGGRGGGGEKLDPGVPVPGCRRLQLPAEQPVRGRSRPSSRAGDRGHRVVPAGGRIRAGRPVEQARVRHRGLRVDGDGPPGRVVHRKCPAECSPARDRRAPARASAGGWAQAGAGASGRAGRSRPRGDVRRHGRPAARRTSACRFPGSTATAATSTSSASRSRSGTTGG